MFLNEQLIIENIRKQYKLQFKEAKDQILSTGLTITLKQDDKERGFVKGTLFTIDTVGSKHVIVKRIVNEPDEIKLDSYKTNVFNLDYKELEDKFELA
jgi:hypothetical protein